MRLSATAVHDMVKATDPEVGFEVPTYRIGNLLRTGIVHIGPGNFHLGHLAYLTHRLLENFPESMSDYEWGIVGVSLNTPDRRNVLNEQDGYYTVVEQNGIENKVEIVGSVKGILFAPENPQRVIDQMSAHSVRIISLAMTENGYYLTPDKKLDVNHPDIQHDLQAGLPKTAIGYIAHALRERHRLGYGGMTILSCDNIVHNGDYTRGAVMEFLQLWDPSLVPVAEKMLTFPNSMVDRIVPKTTPELIESASRQIGYEDRCPVPAEPMPQIPWVIEDKFAAGRPAWEKVGARFVDDVTPYEVMKLRLLNASHAAIASLGDMAGMTYIYEVMQNPVFAGFMRSLMDLETSPTLMPVSVDLEAYKQELETRFGNTAVKDTVQRVATDAPLNTVLDSMRDALKLGLKIDFLSLALAGWIYRMGADRNELGRPVEIKHPLAEEIKTRAQKGLYDPRPVLGMSQLFGELGRDPRVIGPVQEHLTSLYAFGAERTISNLLQDNARRARGLDGPSS